MGKGDTPRPVNKERYDREYDRIFGKKTFLHPSQAKMNRKSQCKPHPKEDDECVSNSLGNS